GVHSAPPPANRFLEADMQEQTYPPQRPNMAHFVSAEEQKARDEWKAQLNRLLDDYRQRYVLRQRPDGTPAP
ncbi:MAG: hypothetical protein ACYDBZ_15850, partial [Steroidobacteraceae bacterium]